jgi:hypothetical protein
MATLHKLIIGKLDYQSISKDVREKSKVDTSKGWHNF